MSGGRIEFAPPEAHLDPAAVGILVGTDQEVVLDGGILESFGRLFKNGLTMYVYPLRDPKTLPTWENPNMLAKYYTTTKGLEMGYRATTASK